LSVQDAIVLFAKTDGAKNIIRVETALRIFHKRGAPAQNGTKMIRHIYAVIDGVIYTGGVAAGRGNIHAVFGGAPNVLRVLTVFGIITMKAFDAILGVFHVIAGATRSVNYLRVFMRLGFEELSKFLPQSFHPLMGVQARLGQKLLILLFG
jgi:hypothetical protein